MPSMMTLMSSESPMMVLVITPPPRSYHCRESVPSSAVRPTEVLTREEAPREALALSMPGASSKEEAARQRVMGLLEARAAQEEADREVAAERGAKIAAGLLKPDPLHPAHPMAMFSAPRPHPLARQMSMGTGASLQAGQSQPPLRRSMTASALSADGKQLPPQPARVRKKIMPQPGFWGDRSKGDLAAAKRNSDAFAAVTLRALVRKKKDDIRWRTPRERWWRMKIAWFVVAVAYFFLSLVVLTFGVKALGPATMNATITAWVIALCQVFLILEPLQICISATMPFCVSEESRCGRCCRRAQWCYNEFFSP